MQKVLPHRALRWYRRLPLSLHPPDAQPSIRVYCLRFFQRSKSAKVCIFEKSRHCKLLRCTGQANREMKSSLEWCGPEVDLTKMPDARPSESPFFSVSHN